jgi:hypothetical protein
MFVFDASATWFATTVTVQVVSGGRSLSGVIVYDEAGELDSEYAIGVPVGHSTVKELVEAVTDFEKFTVIVVFSGTWVAESTGLVEVTAGGVSTVNENV